MRRLAHGLSLSAIIAMSASACGGSPTQPLTTAMTINSVTPPSGSTLTIPPQYVLYPAGGLSIGPGDGLLSANITIRVSHDVPWAQLNVYMQTDASSLGYCGQNVNDSPTWQFITPGWATTVNITGFRIYQMPCNITGFRAMLHMRNNGNLTPPSPSETVVESTFPISLRVQR